MYDSIDGKKVGTLKNVDTTTTSSVTTNPGEKFHIPTYTPMDKINPLYHKLSQIAYDTVLQTMLEGEKEHGVDGWIGLGVSNHTSHVADHLVKWSKGLADEPHLEHLITRLAMIKYLEMEET